MYICVYIYVYICIYIYYEVLPPYFLYIPCSYYNIIDYIPYAVLYIPMAILEKLIFVLLNPFTGIFIIPLSAVSGSVPGTK